MELKITERVLTKQVMDYLKWALPGAWVRKNLGVLGQRRGIPDIEIIHQGVPYFLEIKTPTGRLSWHQKAEIEALKRAGAYVYVVRDVEEVRETFEGKGAQITMNF